MPKLNVKGLEDWSTTLQMLGSKGASVAKAACYDGAAVLADALRQEIQNLPEQSGYMPEGQRRRVVKPTEKQALLDGMGVTRMEEKNGTVTVRVGFTGYSKLRTKRYPEGLPTPIIAASVAGGSKVREKNDFVRRAGKRAEEAAKAAMAAGAAECIEKYLK